MRIRTLAIATALSAGLVSTGSAYVSQKGAERPTVTAGRPARLHRDVTWSAPQGALSALPNAGSWQVIWDRDTDVPLRMWGPPISAPSANHDAAAAETAARAFIASHLGLLAPGAATSDFTLTANRVDGALRTVAFAQSAYGLPVVGGSLAFTFSHDHLVMVSSTAMPHVSVRMPGGSLAPETLASSAKTWLSQAGFPVDIKAQGSRVIIPVVHARGNAHAPQITYRVAETLTVESSRDPGVWDVWLDASDAAPIARHQKLMFASGKILFDTPDRYPGGTRTPKPAPEVNHTIAVAAASNAVTSLMDGTVTWAGDTAAQVTLGLVGPHVKITNKGAALITDTLQLDPGATLVWSKATEELNDSQLTSFVAASTAKQFVKTRINPNLAWLDAQLSVTVNEPQTCNAYSTGDDVHFYKGNAQCENTGRITDVVYHEFGHSVHANSIIDGQGAFDASLSEGLADTLAASITNDHGMGRGFFHTNEALRELDPAVDKKWPDDADGEPHDEGEIIGETLWDLRVGLQAQYGDSAGFEKFLVLYYGVVQRAADIPSAYAAALLTNDNDGDLSNGTPDQCIIDAAFATHGLSNPAVSLGLTAPVRDGFQVSFTLHPPTQNACPPPNVSSATLTWSTRGGAAPADIALTATGSTYAANIPTQADGTVVNYHVTLQLDNGSKITYPENPADPDYQFYVGNVEKIWCANFENGLGDWTVGGTPAQRVEWEVGAPAGIGGDPKAAYEGTSELGIDLGSTDDGLYYGRTTQYAESPEIDLAGETNVRLQYYRWLNVEDGAYDKATILANDTEVWANLASPGMPNVGVNHTDKEWRFQDVDLSAQAATGKVKLKFQLVSDQGLNLGGWNIDAVCIVKAGPPSNLCGNHNVDPGETCDDGNTVDGDGCSATCGADAGTGDGGCCSVGTNPAGPLALSLATLGLVVLRRRRRR